MDVGAEFQRHHAAVWGYLARLGGRDVADDLAGEVFVVAYRRRAAYDPARGDVRPWLYGIATNLWRTHNRSAARRDRALRRLAPDVAVDDVGDRVEAAAEHANVLNALVRLADHEREVLVLHVWEGLTYDAIAVALDIPVGTVRSRLSRARGHLRELLEMSGELHR